MLTPSLRVTTISVRAHDREMLRQICHAHTCRFGKIAHGAFTAFVQQLKEFQTQGMSENAADLCVASIKFFVHK